MEAIDVVERASHTLRFPPYLTTVTSTHDSTSVDTRLLYLQVPSRSYAILGFRACA